jgi:MHS family proline/betaine transporter-like MFS transporter
MHVLAAGDAAVPKVEAKKARTAVMAVVASLIEGYDTTVFGIYAVIIGRMFFPRENEATAVLLAVGTFVTGYLMRPLGAVALGYYADRLGRRRSVAFVVTAMSLSTGVIGLLPTYGQIGLASTLLVILARLIQGFAAGGSNATAAVYIAELVPPGRRGLFISFKHTSQVGSFLFSSLLGTVIFSMAGGEAGGWIWRLPFLLALLVGPVGLYIRYRSVETQAFEEQANVPAPNPVAELFRQEKWRTLLASMTSCLHTVTAFILLLFMPTYAVKQLRLPIGDALFAGTISAILTMIVCTIGGWAADRVGNKPVLLASSFVSMLAVYPCFAYLGAHPTAQVLLVVQSLLGVVTAPFAAVNMALKVEFFPTATRSTGMSVSDSFNTLVFGGGGSFLVTWLMTRTHDPLAPGYYVVAAAALSFFSLLLVRDRMLFKFSA